MFVGLLTIPSLPRYQFQWDTEAKLTTTKHIRVIDRTRIGSLTEPLTLFATPVGKYRLVQPDPIVINDFSEIMLAYDVDPSTKDITVFCDDREMMIYESDPEGIMRAISKDWIAMTNGDYKSYCETNWETERQALREASALPN